MEPAFAVGIAVSVIMLSALIFDRLRLPSILGMLAAGMLIGPFSPLVGLELFGIRFSNIIIEDPSLVEVFAVIGAAFILFGIGLEFSIVKLSQLGAFTFLAAVLKIGIAYLAAYSAFAMLGFSAQASALVAVSLSFSSTPVIIRLLEASGKIRRPEVPFIVSILIIEDLLAVFFLGLISPSSSQLSEYSFAISLLRVVLTFIFAYIILSRLISRFLSLVAHSDELLILSTVSLVLVIGYLSEAIGLSFSIGAFLAGSTIAGSPHSRKIEDKVKPFNSLFAAFFFFSIGLVVNAHSVIAHPHILLIFIGLAMPVGFVASGISSYFAGFSGRSALFCASVLVAMSELSLLIVSKATSLGILPAEILSNFAFAIIISSFASAWLLNRENELYNLLQSAAPAFLVKNMRLMRSTTMGIRRAISESSRYYHVVERLPSISQPHEQLSAREQLALTSKNSVIFAAASFLFYLAVFFSANPAWALLRPLFVFFFISFFASSALFLVNLKSATASLLKMLDRSSSGWRYVPAGHLASSALFLFLCAIYLFAYSFAPSSLAVILILPSFAFMAKSLVSAIRAFSAGSGRL
ncbi:MAG: cation:proton antiporter [Candidatus Micrarchaeota archaeon]|nr:cation:proton antiporter [Candidatus Micrarchaeota archaeon]